MAISSVALTTSPPQANDAGNSATGVSRREAAHFEQALAEVRAKQTPSLKSAQTPPSDVQPGRTPLSGEQAGRAIAAAYEATTGEKPSAEMLAILTSHWSLETAQGSRMYNFNFAGIKGRSPEGMTAVMRTREGYGENTTHIRDGFRAYTSVESGAADYVSLLQRRYAPALRAAREGDPVAFAQELKTGGYYTGNQSLYAQGLTRLANRAMALGLDAIGTNPGALATEAVAIDGHFQGPNDTQRRGSLAQGVPVEAGRSASIEDLLGTGGQGFWGSDQMADEITRAALRIAAQAGTRGRDPNT